MTETNEQLFQRLERLENLSKQADSEATSGEFYGLAPENCEYKDAMPEAMNLLREYRAALLYYANDDNWKDRSDESTDAHFMRSTIALNVLYGTPKALTGDATHDQ